MEKYLRHKNSWLFWLIPYTMLCLLTDGWVLAIITISWLGGMFTYRSALRGQGIKTWKEE